MEVAGREPDKNAGRFELVVVEESRRRKEKRVGTRQGIWMKIKRKWPLINNELFTRT